MAVSTWWVLWAFVGGGCAGIVLMALMFVASAEEDRTAAGATSPLPESGDKAHGVA